MKERKTVSSKSRCVVVYSSFATSILRGTFFSDCISSKKIKECLCVCVCLQKEHQFLFRIVCLSLVFGFFQKNELFFHSSYHYNGIFSVRYQRHFDIFTFGGWLFLYGNGTSVESCLQFSTRCQMKRIHQRVASSFSFFFSIRMHYIVVLRIQVSLLCAPDKYYSTNTNISFSMDFVLFVKLIFFNSLVFLRFIFSFFFVEARFLFVGISLVAHWFGRFVLPECILLLSFIRMINR